MSFQHTHTHTYAHTQTIAEVHTLDNGGYLRACEPARAQPRSVDAVGRRRPATGAIAMTTGHMAADTLLFIRAQRDGRPAARRSVAVTAAKKQTRKQTHKWSNEQQHETSRR